uniref:Uncharacterized protein n=1 Tax=Plectus sambesii TaxID=2011161 RepID=A0A914VFQ1_9BILA
MKASLIIVVFLIAPSCALTPLLMSDIPQHILEITKSHMSLSQLYQYPFQSPSLCQQIRLQ